MLNRFRLGWDQKYVDSATSEGFDTKNWANKYNWVILSNGKAEKAFQIKQINLIMELRVVEYWYSLSKWTLAISLFLSPSFAWWSSSSNRTTNSLVTHVPVSAHYSALLGPKMLGFRRGDHVASRKWNTLFVQQTNKRLAFWKLYVPLLTWRLSETAPYPRVARVNHKSIDFVGHCHVYTNTHGLFFTKLLMRNYLQVAM